MNALVADDDVDTTEGTVVDATGASFPKVNVGAAAAVVVTGADVVSAPKLKLGAGRVEAVSADLEDPNETTAESAVVVVTLGADKVGSLLTTEGDPKLAAPNENGAAAAEGLLAASLSVAPFAPKLNAGAVVVEEATELSEDVTVPASVVPGELNFGTGNPAGAGDDLADESPDRSKVTVAGLIGTFEGRSGLFVIVEMFPLRVFDVEEMFPRENGVDVVTVDSGVDNVAEVNAVTVAEAVSSVVFPSCDFAPKAKGKPPLLES